MLKIFVEPTNLEVGICIRFAVYMHETEIVAQQKMSQVRREMNQQT